MRGALRFRYEGGATPGRVREVTPFGLLFGRSNYLVAAEDAATGPRNSRLDRILDMEVLDRTGAPPRPEGFSLQAYADESFGIYQDDTEDVVLAITPAGAEDALRWRFHANQIVEPAADGGVTVRFRASGMLELAWHLFTWGDKVRIVAPPAPAGGASSNRSRSPAAAHASGTVAARFQSLVVIRNEELAMTAACDYANLYETEIRPRRRGLRYLAVLAVWAGLFLVRPELARAIWRERRG